MKVISVYEQILKDCIHSEMDIDEILFFMVVLHTHAIALAPAIILEDFEPEDKPTIIEPLTRWHISELVSNLWDSGKRSQDSFWYDLYSDKTPYELFDDIPNNLLSQANKAKVIIEQHPLVDKLIEE